MLTSSVKGIRQGPMQSANRPVLSESRRMSLQKLVNSTDAMSQVKNVRMRQKFIHLANQQVRDPLTGNSNYQSTDAFPLQSQSSRSLISPSQKCKILPELSHRIFLNNKKRANLEKQQKDRSELFYKNQKLLEKLNKIANRKPFATKMDLNNLLYRR
jgi:hypothetical protein